MDLITQYYNKFNEDKRLLSRHGQVEFAVTMKYISKVIGKRKGLDIIDIGAGTGRYSAALADMAHNVTAVELVQKNVSQIREKNKDIKAIKGNALNLKLPDNTFDIALLFGPIYHLFSFEDKTRAISEAKRVVKPGGYIFIMYLTNDYAVITYAFKEGNLEKCINEGTLNRKFEVKNKEEDLYSYVRIDEINKLKKASGLKRFKIIGVDGATDYIRPTINKLSEQDFKTFIKYQETICERKELLGASSHIMDILKRPE